MSNPKKSHMVVWYGARHGWWITKRPHPQKGLRRLRFKHQIALDLDAIRSNEQ